MPHPTNASIVIEKAFLGGCVNRQLRIAGNSVDPFNPDRWETYYDDDNLYFTVLDKSAIWVVSNEYFNGNPIISPMNETARHLTPHLPIPKGYTPDIEMTYTNLALHLTDTELPT
jgi:hypothetical protein